MRLGVRLRTILPPISINWILKLAVAMVVVVLFPTNPAIATPKFSAAFARLSLSQPAGLLSYPLRHANRAASNIDGSMSVSNRLLLASASEILQPRTHPGNESSQDGNDIRPDAPETERWYRKFAEQGYAGAQHNLALIYHLGQGVSQD